MKKIYKLSTKCVNLHYTFPNFLYQDWYNMPFYNFVIVIYTILLWPYTEGQAFPKKVLNSFLQLTDTVITNNF